MPTLLHITVSPRGHHSISRQLGVVMQGRVFAGDFLAPYLTELAAAVSV
jgi:hypothetical protein